MYEVKIGKIGQGNAGIKQGKTIIWTYKDAVVMAGSVLTTLELVEIHILFDKVYKRVRRISHNRYAETELSETLFVTIRRISR